MLIETVAQIIRTRGVDRAGHPAIRYGDDAISYGEIYARARRVANGLRAAGIGAGDHVCLLDRNGPETIEAWFGCSLIGAVFTPVNWRLAPREVALIVRDAEAKVLVVGAEYGQLYAAIGDELPAVSLVLSVGVVDGIEPWTSWRDRQSDAETGYDSESDALALQMYSSGTTGLPKGVMLSHRNLLAAVPEAVGTWGFAPDVVALVVLPLFHIAGAGWALWGLVTGATLVIVRDADPERIVRTIEVEHVTHVFLVPALLQFCLQTPAVREIDVSRLRLVKYGASPISTQVMADAVRTFRCRIAQGYGLTETTGPIVSLPPEDHDPDGPNAHRLRSAGRPLAGVEIRIVDMGTGEDVPLGAVGEIWVRGPQVMLGYWGNPDGTARAIVDGGWLRTGDAGYLDADGYLYIHDRVKDMIVSGGENVYPAEVENVLMSHPAVVDVAVIGVPHDRWGETPKALVVLRSGARVPADELIAWCRERLARYKCPTSVDLVEALPRNPSGKILKRELRAPFWAGHDRQVN